MGGTRAAWGGRKKSGWDVSWKKLSELAFGINADQWTIDCSPGRGGMAEDGGTKSGKFHGEIDHCRESQG